MSNVYCERLDTIRFYAVFMVIFAHIFQIWTWAETTSLSFPVGNTGVLIFFVLSGFLITRILLAESQNTLGEGLKNFYVRRTLRIFPIYYLYLLVMFSLDMDHIRQAGFTPWLYVTNIYLFQENTWLDSNSHLWTLSLEEQFYIVWPLLILSLKNKKTALLTLFVGLISVSLLTRIYLLLEGFSISPQIEVFSLANLDSLVFGGLLALLYMHYPVQLKRYGLPMIFIGLFGYYLILGIKFTLGGDVLFWSVGKFLVVVFAGGLVLYALFSQNKHHLLHNKVTVHLGTISYGLYLYHNVIVAYYDQIANFFFIPINDHILTKIVLSLFFTILVAQVSYTVIERPLLKLKRHFA